jgi:hypothetical protein
MGTSLPELKFLTWDPGYIDYRPAIDVTYNRVVFERTPAQGDGPTVLYLLPDISASDPPVLPVLFLSDTSQTPPVSQTRPDWCWKTNAVAFNGAASNSDKDSLSVWQVDGDGQTNLQPISNTTRAAYPRWSLDGSEFVTENHGASASPKPCNTIFDNSGNVNFGNINGRDSKGIPLFGGMPAVGAGDLPKIAFAGQPAVIGWGGSTSQKAHYDEDTNYIFVNTVGEHGTVSSSPLEVGACVTTFDPHFQARAPSWSPDGKTVAFESTRNEKGYAIYLYDTEQHTVRQVTDPSLGGQHAKFFHDGTKLILSIHHPQNDPPTRGIAYVDITDLLKP